MKLLTLGCAALLGVFAPAGNSPAAGVDHSLRASAPHGRGHHHPGFRGDRRPHFYGHFGIFLGLPLFVPWWYYDPAYLYDYPGPVRGVMGSVHAVPETPVYIEKDTRYRWYCPDPDGYYPTVQRCDGRWQLDEINAPAPPETPVAGK